MSHPPERPRQPSSSSLDTVLHGLRWFLRQFTGSAAGAAHLEHIVVAGACAFCGLLAFKHYGVALEGHERLQAARINSPRLPSAEDYASSLGIGVDPMDFPRCSLVSGCRGDDQCFAAGTLISTEDGLRAIEQIHEGDRVWARDVESGAIALKPVSHTFVRAAAPVIDLELTTPGIGSERLSVTPSHRFWVEGEGWQRADALVNTSVWSPESPFFATALTSREQTTTVYNFEVEDFHSYFVGESRVLVHNDCTDEPGEHDEHEGRDRQDGRDAPPAEPACFDRPSRTGLKGFEPRRVYDDEVENEPGFVKKTDDDGRDYWGPDEDLLRKMMEREEDRQLAAQQAELNQMTVARFLENRKAWQVRLTASKLKFPPRPRKRSRANGRPLDDKRVRTQEIAKVRDALMDHYQMAGLSEEEAKAAVKADIAGTGALHRLDGIAGGNGIMHGLGNGVVNSRLGDQWTSRAREVEIWARTQKPGSLMNVQIRYCDP